MESNYLTSGDLAMWDTARTSRAGNYYGDGYGYYHRRDNTAATGIGLAAGLGGGALLFAAAGIWAINQASKARARGAENQSNAHAKTVELLSQVVSREATRQDGVNIDVTQTLRSLTRSAATGGTASSNALATAEALALLNQQNANSSINSAIGGCNFLRVARYSAPQPCGCDTCGD